MVSLAVRNLSCTIRNCRILSEISFDARAPALVGLVGPNGSGKTTLIRCIDGILWSEGSVSLDGEEMSALPRMEVARRVAYVPQGIRDSSASLVFDTVLMGRRPHLSWSIRKTDEEEVIRALELLGVDDLAFRQLRTLSGGERQRVMIARALTQGSPLLLLDEPTSALDLRNAMEVMGLIRRLAVDEGRLAIMAIHDLNLAARYCTEIIVLCEGSIVARGPPADVFTPDVIGRVYGVDAVIEQRGKIPYIFPLSPRKRA
ncbi:MAG: iron complex transport system permease protein [Methanofollis sp.]|nr:iron complex transport system permease protein [Methanofollis sp.]